MPFVRMMRMLSAMESGQLSGAALEALLQEPGRLGELQVLVADRALFKRLQDSSATMAAVLGSTTATSMVMDAAPDSLLNRHADLMMNSQIAVQKILVENRWRNAVCKSQTALIALCKNAITLTAFRSAPIAFTAKNYHTNINYPLPITSTGANGLYLVLGASTSSSSDLDVAVAPALRGTSSIFKITKSTGDDGISGAGPIAVVIGGGASAPTCMRTSDPAGYSSLRLMYCGLA